MNPADNYAPSSVFLGIYSLAARVYRHWSSVIELAPSGRCMVRVSVRAVRGHQAKK